MRSGRVEGGTAAASRCPQSTGGYGRRRRWLAGGLTAALVPLLLSSCVAVAPRRIAAEPPVAPPPAVPATAATPSLTDDLPRHEVLELAMRAYDCGRRAGEFTHPLLTLIDYSLPSTAPRLWVIDLRDTRVLHHELVAHGENSGETTAIAFSNQIGSHQSSLGLFRTGESYLGQYGYSLRLSGLEPGFNDHARERAIVIHGAPDVSRAYIATWGAIGRSWGCPALPVEVSTQVIDRIAGGSAVFAYYPDPDWLRESSFLHCDAPSRAAEARAQLTMADR